MGKGGSELLRRSVLLLVTLLALVAAATAAAGTNLSLVGYSIPTAVFPKLFTAYQATPAGKDVSFSSSFAASEVQSKAVAAGLPADVVVFPNPFSSGGARWDVVAAYGAMLREHKTPKQAVAYLGQLFRHNVSQDTSGRNALNTFLSGRGDVLLDYESDAKLAQSQGKPVFYLIPKATLQIETPLAAVDGSNKAEAQKFVNWLYTPAAQTIWAQNGFRPVDPTVLKRYKAQFPPRPQLFTIGFVGGWAKVNTQFFDPTNGIVAKIEQGLGVSTGG